MGFSTGCGESRKLFPCPRPEHPLLTPRAAAGAEKISQPYAFAHWGGHETIGTCYDATVLGLNGSWFYNWLPQPYFGTTCDHYHQAAEFVPTISKLGMASTIMKEERMTKHWKSSGVTHLLGYNEPDGYNENAAKCTPAQAAADWVHVQVLASKFDPPLVLVSPAVVSGVHNPGGYSPDGASEWMDQFFGNCTHVVPECDPSLIKFIAMHDYYGDAPALMRRIKGARARYGGRKIWLTEFAILHYGNPPPRAAMNDFMREVLPLLDASDDVARYAWLAARNPTNNMNGGSNLLSYDTLSMQLTSTGAIYAIRYEGYWAAQCLLNPHSNRYAPVL